MNKIRTYLSLVKFSHTIFALPFAMIGFVLGIMSLEGSVSWIMLLLVLLCMIFARNAAMSFNRFVDKNFDAKNPRTANREIPAGFLSASNVFIFSIINSSLFVICTFFINKLCFYLSPIALIIILGYSFAKRFTAFCHLILGIGLSLAPLGAYLAVTGKYNFVPLLFSGCVVFWVAGFDIIYALQDEVFDKENKLHSIPAFLGASNALLVSRILHMASAATLVVAGLYGNFEWLYWLGFSLFTGLLIYQQLLVKPKDFKKVDIAFMTVNGFASILFSCFVIADLFFLSK